MIQILTDASAKGEFAETFLKLIIDTNESNFKTYLDIFQKYNIMKLSDLDKPISELFHMGFPIQIVKVIQQKVKNLKRKRI